MASPRAGIRRRSLLILLVLTAVTLVTLDQQRDSGGPIGAAGRVAHELVAPVRWAAAGIADPVGRWFEGVREAGTLREENERLRHDLAEARARLDQADDAIRENRELHGLLELPYPLSAQTTTARVVGPSSGNFERTVIIDRGSDHGVRVDMPVTAAGGLYGRVIEVFSEQSKVLLLTDPTFRVAVRTSSGRIGGIASGTGASTVRLEFLTYADDDATLRRGDAVLTAGVAASLFPPGIPVGAIDAIDEAPGEGVIGARVRPIVDLGVVEFVLVVDPASVTVPPPPPLETSGRTRPFDLAPFAGDGDVPAEEP